MHAQSIAYFSALEGFTSAIMQGGALSARTGACVRTATVGRTRHSHSLRPLYAP